MESRHPHWLSIPTQVKYPMSKSSAIHSPMTSGSGEPSHTSLPCLFHRQARWYTSQQCLGVLDWAIHANRVIWLARFLQPGSPFSMRSRVFNVDFLWGRGCHRTAFHATTQPLCALLLSKATRVPAGCVGGTLCGRCASFSLGELSAEWGNAWFN